jgi:hypothetical protein
MKDKFGSGDTCELSLDDTLADNNEANTMQEPDGHFAVPQLQAAAPIPAVILNPSVPRWADHRRPDNSHYQGYMVNAKREGHGTFTDKSGNRYEGEWKDDKACGYGVKTFSHKGNKRGSSQGARQCFTVFLCFVCP